MSDFDDIVSQLNDIDYDPDNVVTPFDLVETVSSFQLAAWYVNELVVELVGEQQPVEVPLECVNLIMAMRAMSDNLIEMLEGLNEDDSSEGS